MKTELELKQLRVFVTVVETGAHTRAAQALGISQSTVSETLNALERTLGTALFRKAPKGPMLTVSGEALLPFARQMLALRSEMVAQVAKVSTEVSATLVVSAVESLSAYVLPSKLDALRDHWPNVRMEVIAGACSQIRESVASGRSDLGLVVEAETGSRGSSILARARLTIFASPLHPLAAGKVKSAVGTDRLHTHTFYMSDAAGDYHQVLRQYFEAAQLPAPRTESLGSVEGVKRGILASKAALGLLAAYALEQELHDGVLSEVRITPALPEVVVRAVIAPGSSNSPVVVDLIQSLRDWSLTKGSE
ncbi:MAG TPA: LysR family transcriptional regulator [Steroidobacteraceae bacterium]|nr:LysR family transcriptional regulator [Steroidobacteraceae bacterium]